MATSVTITRVRFRNYKVLRNFSVTLGRANILVGANNAGKSTLLGAFRVLAAGLQRAHARRPERVSGPGGSRMGYPVAAEAMPISIENVHTNYDNTDTTVTFDLSNGSHLQLYFNPEGDCVMLTEHGGRPIRGPADFRREFPIRIGAVPVLGQVEHEEQLVQTATVQRNLTTHRASRNFRNYWYQNAEGFELFREQVRETWPGMDILRPELTPGIDPHVVMFCVENRIDRELYWVGAGFQIWCQLLTHINRERDATLIVIDEPEIYLHPQIQRTLLSILKRSEADYLIATHSSEIIQEANPSDLLIIDGSQRSARRVGTTAATEEALRAIGSAQTSALTNAARTQRVVFVEGNDFKLLRELAGQIGFRRLADGAHLTPITLGGFQRPQQVTTLADAIRQILGKEIEFAVILDRDYRPEDEIAEMVDRLAKSITITHVHGRKEIENYLLIPELLDQAIKAAVEDRARKIPQLKLTPMPAAEILEYITNDLKNELQGQYSARNLDYHKGSGTDQAVIISETHAWFEMQWSDLATRIPIVPGKNIFSLLNKYLQDTYKISISTRDVLKELRRDDVPGDLFGLLKRLDEFGKMNA